MFRLLVNAYACSPGMGSEPGMAWNWIANLAPYFEMHIITEGEFRERIEAALPAMQYGANLHFYYNPVPNEIRRMCWNQGDWRFYRYYKKWQWKTYLMAKDICKKERIDALHQLNMIGFREPGYLWKLSQETGIPFVWGPVDAKDSFPLRYARDADWRTRLFLWLKNKITLWQLQHSKRVRKAAKAATLLLAASGNSVKSFERYLGVRATLVNETGCVAKVADGLRSGDGKFNVLWVGKLDFRKQLGLALGALANAWHGDIRLHIVGGGNAISYQRQAADLGILDLCEWHGAVTHSQVQDLMRRCDVLLFTSVAEGTPHVVLEAIANGLPVVCFDTCGQGDIVDNQIGMKVALSDPEKSKRDFANCIELLYNNREILRQMSENCFARAKELSWERKAERFSELLISSITPPRN